MRVVSFHPRKQLVFGLLSLGDLFLTWVLLRPFRSEVYEANPLANWWLEQHGWLGLAGFKVAFTLVVVCLVIFICRYRPSVGGRILWFSCVALACVVFYSASLWLLRTPSSEQQEKVFRAHLREVNREASRVFQQGKQFRVLRAQVGKRILSGRCTLAEGVDRLAALDRAKDPSFLKGLAFKYPGCSLRESLARNLIIRMVSARNQDSNQVRSVYRRLQQMYRNTYGQSLPDDLLVVGPMERDAAQNPPFVSSSPQGASDEAQPEQSTACGIVVLPGRT